MYTSTITSALLLASTVLATGNGGYGGGGTGNQNNDNNNQGGGNNNGYGSGGWSSWGGASSTGVVPAAAAASGTPPMPPPAGELLVQVVSVSDASGSLKYFPDSVQAPVGSIVQFQFHPKNHTITESTFAAPCKPVALSNSSLITTTRPGLKSGFVPVTPSDSSTPVYNVLINDTKPIWLYCGQVNHCQKGMAMVINQALTGDKTIEAYIAAAKALPLAGSSSTASTTSVAAAPPPPGASTSVVVVAPPPAATSASLPPPTPASASATTSGPATFTGAASVQRVEGRGVIVGLAVVGFAAALL